MTIGELTLNVREPTRDELDEMLDISTLPEYERFCTADRLTTDLTGVAPASFSDAQNLLFVLFFTERKLAYDEVRGRMICQIKQYFLN